MTISLDPEKLSGLQTPTKTSTTEVHFALAGAGLDYDNVTEYVLAGSTDPGSFDLAPSGSNLDIKGGTTAVTQSRHQQEADYSLSVNLREWTTLGATMANKSDFAPVITDSSVVTNALTVEAGSTKNLLTITSAQASGLTTGHRIYREAGPVGFKVKEERYVKKVSGETVTLFGDGFSAAPATNSLVTVAAIFKMPKGGGALQSYTIRSKTTADSGDTHITHIKDAQAMAESKMVYGSNSAIMRPELVFGINAQVESALKLDGTSESDFVFCDEYMIPKVV